MNRFFGIIGIVFLLGIALLMSNNRKAINIRLVITGLLMQIGLALFILKVPLGQYIFQKIGDFITALLEYSNEGARFAFGFLANKDFLADKLAYHGIPFIFTILPSIIFICVLVSIAYHVGIMQRIVAILAKGVHKILRVSGSEALSNVSSAFVGQVEAQIMIKPYLSGMTKSELMASMTGSFACISGGVMAIYISFGVPAAYLLAASIMAAPAALVVSKIVYPETEASETKGKVSLEVKKEHSNIMDAISHGASDGMKISLNVIAMLIGVIALIALIDAGLGYLGKGLMAIHVNLSSVGIDVNHLNLKSIIGSVFSIVAYAIGVPIQDAHTVGSLMGTKMVMNEFLAYSDLSQQFMHTLSKKSIVIASFALCGFANFSSIAIQIGGIGQLAPNRRNDITKLGFKAMICGTIASYLSAALAGMLI